MNNNIYEIFDYSYNLAIFNGNLSGLEYNKNPHNKYKILGTDCKLPIDMSGGTPLGMFNDTIIRNTINGLIVFTQRRLIRSITEKMLTVDGKEYSESTIKNALREYVK